MLILKYRLVEFVSGTDACHWARRRFTETRAQPPHTHDFCEVFWVESGAGWHQVNGRARPLRAGHVFFVRAEDRHGFAAADSRTGLEITNVAFARRAWSRLRARYFGRSEIAWDFLPVPRREMTLPLRVLAQLRAAGEELASGRRGPAALDRFLLNLLFLIDEPTLPAAHPSANPPPDWLRRACESARLPTNLADGVPALVRHAARSPEHVARQFRLHLGCTPTDWINQARMAYAAERLGGSDAKILDIIAECGLQNPRHFYALFYARYGLTPRQFRLREQRVLQPSGR